MTRKNLEQRDWAKTPSCDGKASQLELGGIYIIETPAQQLIERLEALIQSIDISVWLNRDCFFNYVVNFSINGNIPGLSKESRASNWQRFFAF